MSTDPKSRGFWLPNSSQIPNWLLDRVFPEVSEAITKVLLVVCRKTFGWHKEWDCLSISQLVKLTGMSDRSVEGAVAALVKSTLLQRGKLRDVGWEYRLNVDCDIAEALKVLRVKERKPYTKPRQGGEINSGGGEKISSRKDFAGGGEINSHNPELISPTKETLTKPTLTKKKESAEASSATVELLPLNDGTEYGVTEEQIKEWERLYPAVDVLQAVRSMRGWLLASEKRRKTRTGICRFVNSWLARDQNDAGFRKNPVGVGNNGSEKTKAIAQPASAPALPPEMQAGAGARAWDYIRGRLEECIGPHSFDTWIKPLRSVGILGTQLYVRIPCPEFQYVKDKFSELIAGGLKQFSVGDRALELVLVTGEDLESVFTHRSIAAD